MSGDVIYYCAVRDMSGSVICYWAIWAVSGGVICHCHLSVSWQYRYFSEGTCPGGSGSSFVGGEMVTVCTHSDDMAVVSVIKSVTTSSQQSMHLLRCLFFYCAFCRFCVSCVHVPGAFNTVVDSLSRDNV